MAQFKPSLGQIANWAETVELPSDAVTDAKAKRLVTARVTLGQPKASSP